MGKRLKIAFVASSDVHDARSVSGAPYFISRLLQKYCGDVDCIHKLRPECTITWKYQLRHPFYLYAWIYRIEKIKQKYYKIIGKHYQIERSLALSRYFARRIEKKLKGKRYDVIFAERCSVEIAMVRTDIPIIYDSDAVFHAMIDYYPEFTNLSRSSIRQGDYLEKKALDKARFFLPTSEWAARSAETYYDMPPNKIKVISHPARLYEIPDRRNVLRDKPSDICRLLFIGVNWYRKRGDIAVETLNELHRFGVKSQLTIVGAMLPQRHAANTCITQLGFINKNNQQCMINYQSSLLNADFFLSPVKADCLALSLIEAAAYGLPIIGINTGGIGMVVKHNDNGILLDSSAGGGEFAEAIQVLWEDRKKYNAMRARSREIFEEELSEEVWARKMLDVLESL